MIKDLVSKKFLTFPKGPTNEDKIILGNLYIYHLILS